MTAIRRSLTLVVLTAAVVAEANVPAVTSCGWTAESAKTGIITC